MPIFAPTTRTAPSFDFATQLVEAEERDRRSKPAKVVLRHFSALRFQIEDHADALDLNKILYFQQQRAKSVKCDKDELRKILFNAWSTEYALRFTGSQENDEFLGFAMHWAIPQAYYSAYLTLQAFQRTVGAIHSSHKGAIKGFIEGVKTNKYPECISFYCDGEYNSLNIVGLPSRGNKEPLAKVNSVEDAHSQIAMLIKSTRQSIGKASRKEKQESSKPILTKSGKVCQQFTDFHWAQVLKPTEATTLFHFLYRMRLKANYQDIQSFIEAEINFVEFHNCLQAVVGYLNFVHESYVAKCLGKEVFDELVSSFPRHPSTNPVVIERWEGTIKNILVH